MMCTIAKEGFTDAKNGLPADVISRFESAKDGTEKDTWHIVGADRDSFCLSSTATRGSKKDFIDSFQKKLCRMDL